VDVAASVALGVFAAMCRAFFDPREDFYKILQRQGLALDRSSDPGG
jgi:hypothetical protein